MTATESRLRDLFDELVPARGKADTVAGEIVRAVNRIVYRNWNDGDHIGVGYGNETCNPAARYLMTCAGDEVRKTVSSMWGMRSDSLYDAGLRVLELQVLDYLDTHPELMKQTNTEDMLDYRIPSEDRDDGEEWSGGDDEDEW